MSINERITKSLDTLNIEEFTELVNTSSQYINDIFSHGLLHHMLTKYPDLSMEFYTVVVDNLDTNLNYNSPAILPPILRTTRDDIIDLLLSKPLLNVNTFLVGNRSIAMYAIDVNNLSLLEKLTKTHKLDITQCELINYTMSKNMDSFRILLVLLEPYMCNSLKLVDHAIRSNNAEALELLLSVGCSIDITSVNELVNTNSDSMIGILIKYLPKVANKQQILRLAIKNNNLVLFRAVSKFTHNINYDDVYNNLDRPEIITEIIGLANSKNDPELIRTIFMAIVASTNPTHYQLLDTLNIDEQVGFELVHSLLAFNKLDELETLVENTKVLKDVISDMADEILPGFIRAGKTGVVKSIVENYNLGLDNKFIRLDDIVKGKHYDILLMLLTRYQITIRNETIMSTLITDKQYELVQLLIEKYMILPTSREIDDTLLDRPEIVKALIRLEPRLLSRNITIENLVKILYVINDDELLERFIGALEYHKLRDLLRIRGNLDILIRDPNNALKLLQQPRFADILFERVLHRVPMGPFDDDEEDREDREARRNNYVIFKMLQVLNKEQIDDLLTMIIDNNVLDDFIFLSPLDRIITMNNGDLFRQVLERMFTYIDSMDTPELSNLLRHNPTITLENIDRLLSLSNIIVTDSIHSLMVLLEDPKFNEALRSSNVIDRVLDHPNMTVNSLIDQEYDPENPDEENKVSILDIVIGQGDRADYNVKNWRNTERLRLVKKLLSHPELDVNIENEYDQTIMEYLVDSIATFVNIDYESDENFKYPHALVRLIMAHPRFDVNANRKVFPTMFSYTDRDYSYLFTCLVSRPECDVNYCRLLHAACDSKRTDIVRTLLGINNVDVNLVVFNEEEEKRVTPMHVAIDKKSVDIIKLLLEDPRLDITVLDSKGRNYSRLAAKTGLREVVALFAARGVVDDKQERIDREIAEYEARMAAQGRVKQTRIRETLNSFDLILKERETRVEDLKEDFSGSITAYNRSICPFCLTYLEKDQPYECLYLAGHKCPEELENEPLKRLYFGEAWATKDFEICCTCGRPCERHGHFTPVETGGPSQLARNGKMANHWVCNEHNGGGGKLEMVTRLLGMLSELKRRVDTDERLVYGPELIRELAMIANASLFNGAIRDRATAVLERKKWNVNSKIPKYAKFNAPNNTKGNNNNSRKMKNVREPIVHYDNPEQELQCMICLDEARHLFKPHEGDEGYICDECLKRQVCASRYASVTCELGCRPKKQIYKEDVNALMGGNFCEDVEMAEARANADE